MKKYLLIAVLVFSLASSSYAQFSAGYTNAGNVITFKLRPSATTTCGFSVMEFFVRYPESSPVFTYGTPVANTTNFPGMTVNQTAGQGAWEIQHDLPEYKIAGYHVDHIFYTAPAPVTASTTYTAQMVYDVVSIPVIGADGQTVNFELVHQSTESSFYLALTNDLGADVRPAVVTDYFFPATSTAEGPDGSTIYFSGLAVPLPVKFTGFSAIKKDNSAVLVWQIENESSLTDHYEIERSLNGSDFTKVYTLAAKKNGKSNNSYEIADPNLSSIRAAGMFYYRVKQVDKDGRFINTGIKSIRLNTNGLVLAIYPNPIKNVANLTMDSEKDANASIIITDASGKQIQSIQLQLFKGPNIKNINMEHLASGSYMLKVQTATEIKTLSVVKTN